jgi:hypothetical protein
MTYEDHLTSEYMSWPAWQVKLEIEEQNAKLLHFQEEQNKAWQKLECLKRAQHLASTLEVK